MKESDKMIYYLAEDDDQFLLLEPDLERLYWAKIVYNKNIKDV